MKNEKEAMHIKMLAMCFLVTSHCLCMNHNDSKQLQPDEVREFTGDGKTWHFAHYNIKNGTGVIVRQLGRCLETDKYHPLRKIIGSQMFFATNARCGASSRLSVLPSHILRDIVERSTLCSLSEEQQESALVDAVISNDQEAVERFVGYGIDVNCPNAKHYPIIFAAIWSSVPMVSRLLAAGARVDVQDSKCNTPLWVATNEECRKMLLDAFKKENPVRCQFYEFCDAFDNDDDEKLKKLIAAGLSPDSDLCYKGEPVIFGAVALKKTSILKVLIEAGAHLEVRSRCGKCSLLELAKRTAPEYESLIRTAIQKRK